MIRFIFIKLVRILKNPDFIMDAKVGSFDLLEIIFNKLIESIRGVLRLRKIAFIGKQVKLNSKSNIRIGKSLVVGDYSFINALGEQGLVLGDACSIGRFSIISVSGSFSDIGKGIVIGDNVGIGDYAHIGGAGGVSIGSDTIIGCNFSVHPENHNFMDLDLPIRLQGVNRQGIIIGRNCWIGAKVTVLDGAKIGNGSVVAAGSVVRGEFPDNAIIAGVPAKVIKLRSANG